MKCFTKRAVIALGAASIAFLGCTRITNANKPELVRTVSVAGDNPFGGTPAVEIPSDARAMSAFLKAEVAMNEGDREEALKDYAESVQYDPANAALKVRLATLYVRDGRLKEALDLVNQALVINPDSADARLLGAGISSALGDDAAAEKDYREVLRLNPKNQEAYLYLGTLYAKRSDYGEAEKTFQQLIKLDPNSFLGYYYAGKVMVAAKNFPAAEKYYQKALDLNKSELVLLDFALLRERQERPQDALVYYNKITEINPNNELVRKRKAEILVGQKKYDQALDELKRVEQVETNPADTRTKIGLLYVEQGNFDDAATEFNLVLGSEQGNYRVHYYLGTVYTELSESAKAIAEFHKIPKDNEHYVESRLQLAYLYDKQNKYDDALGALKDALTKKPGDAEIEGFMVGVYQEKKDYPTAIELARKMVATDPKNDKFHFTLGAALDQNKQRDDGMTEMKKAIELNPANAQALNYLGYSYAEKGTNLGEAEKLIKRALDIEPEDGFYVDSLGWVYYQKGDYKRAVEQLERAVNLTGSDPTITEHLGDAYRRLGKVKEASHEYSDALKKANEIDQVARLKDKLQVLQNAASAGH